MLSGGHRLISEYDERMLKEKDYSLIEEANEKLCQMAKKETDDILGRVLFDASVHMKCKYSRADN